jgi:hypothetical protein
MSRTERCLCGGSITLPYAGDVGAVVDAHNRTERHRLWRVTLDLDPLVAELSRPGPPPFRGVPDRTRRGVL